MNLTGRTFKSFKLKKQGWIKDIIKVLMPKIIEVRFFAQRLKSKESLNYT